MEQERHEVRQIAVMMTALMDGMRLVEMMGSSWISAGTAKVAVGVKDVSGLPRTVLLMVGEGTRRRWPHLGQWDFCPMWSSEHLREEEQVGQENLMNRDYTIE